MCTVISNRVKGHPKTASKDIVVYKLGHSLEEGEMFKSPYCRFCYKKDELYTTEFTFATSGQFDDIEGEYRQSLNNPQFVAKGFHALIELDVERLTDDSLNIYTRALFIIPKGAKYYVNPAKCIVSNQIIFKEFLP